MAFAEVPVLTCSCRVDRQSKAEHLEIPCQIFALRVGALLRQWTFLGSCWLICIFRGSGLGRKTPSETGTETMY